MNFLLPQFTIKRWVTYQNKFINMFLSWIYKTYMTNVPRTSPESPIIWSPTRPVTGSRRRPGDIPIYNFWIFVFPVRKSNECVKQRLLHLKAASTGPLGNLQGTSPGRRVPAGNWSNFIVWLPLIWEILGNRCIVIVCLPGHDVMNFCFF